MYGRYICPVEPHTKALFLPFSCFCFSSHLTQKRVIHLFRQRSNLFHPSPPKREEKKDFFWLLEFLFLGMRRRFNVLTFFSVQQPGGKIAFQQSEDVFSLKDSLFLLIRISPIAVTAFEYEYPIEKITFVNLKYKSIASDEQRHSHQHRRNEKE